MIVKTTVSGTEPALSIFSHAPAPIRGKRNREKWPQFICGRIPTSLACSQKVVPMGGHRLWTQRSVDDSLTWDARWAVTHRSLWKCLISDTLAIGGSVNGGLTPSSDDLWGQPSSRSSTATQDRRMGGQDNSEMSSPLLSPWGIRVIHNCAIWLLGAILPTAFISLLFDGEPCQSRRTLTTKIM